MAGAKLEFENGWFGIERCANAVDGQQFLMAHIHNKARGLTTSAPVDLDEALKFAQTLIQQVRLARHALSAAQGSKK